MCVRTPVCRMEEGGGAAINMTLISRQDRTLKTPWRGSGAAFNMILISR